ncbi:MAG: CRTAC1 family protein [Terriglobia bacterium]
MKFQRREFLRGLTALGAFAANGMPSPPGKGTKPGPAGAAPSLASQITFRNVAAEAGITPLIICGGKNKQSILEVNGSGCVWFDYNNDGYVDLYIVNGSDLKYMLNPSLSGPRPRNYLYRNNGDGTFTDVTHEAGVEGKGWGCGAVAADYNNDGFVDLFVYNFGPNILYRNNGNGTFTDVTPQAGLAGDNIWSGGAAFGDYDNDGFLDLYVSGYINLDLKNPPHLKCTFEGFPVTACGPLGLPGAPDTLYHNNGDGTFTDVTVKAGVTNSQLRYGFSVAFEDLDGDGRPDIVVMNDSVPNYLYHNNGDGTFEESALLAGIAYNGDGHVQSNMGLAVGDIDNDGWMDLFITTFADDNFTLFHNTGRGVFDDISYPSGIATPTIPYLGWSTFFMDFNNDGWKDIFCVEGHIYIEALSVKMHAPYRQRPQLFQNLHNRTFREVGAESGLGNLFLAGRGGACCDYDNDGALDAAIICIDDHPVLLHNDGGSLAGNWLQVKTMGVKSNRDGVGALVKVGAGDLVQYDRVRTGCAFMSSCDMRLHFGLGAREKADYVEIHWPSGHIDKLAHLAANQVVVVREGEGQIPSHYKPIRKKKL